MTAPAISLYARKGGNGRTLMTQQLAGVAAERGGKVLIIDQDPQGSISKNFFGVTEIERLRAHQTVAAVYQGNDYNISDIIRQTNVDNISVAPSSDHLEPFDFPRSMADCNTLHALRRFVDSVNADYHLILIDTPPNVSNLLGWASLAASDFVVTPVLPAKNSIEAIRDVQKRIDLSIAEDNPELIDLGYFLTNYDGRKGVHQLAHRVLIQRHGEQLFETIVKNLKGFEVAPYGLRPVTHREPASTEAKLVRELFDEVMRRIALRTRDLGKLEEAIAQNE